MSDPSASRSVTIVNPEGLHARPAYMFAELAATFDAKVEIVKEGERIDGKSILSILTLAAEKDSELLIEATGSDAKAALNALAELVEQGFPGAKSDEQPNETT